MQAPASLQGFGSSRVSWRRRAKQFVGLHLRQVPCLHAVIGALPHTLRCWRRRSYQTLGQDEEGDGAEVEDRRQYANVGFGQVMVKSAMLCMVGITVLLVVRSGKYDHNNTDWMDGLTQEQFDHEEFQRDAPLLLYLAAVELLICGACAQTAANMYTRRRHALRHPKDCGERERARYMQVRLEKDPGREDSQLYGLGFRPSSDGLECLLVEDVRPGSLLDLWNQKALRGCASAGDGEQNIGGSSGVQDQSVEADPGAVGTVPSTAATEAPGAAPTRRPERVHPGAAVVAVNNVTADVGLMQVELTKAAVTLWVRSEVYHPSQLESEVLAEPDAVVVPGGGHISPYIPSELHLQAQQQHQQEQLELEVGSNPGPTFLGRSALGHDAIEPMVHVQANSGPCCACVAFEDEEPQILTRWLICSVMFGWVTLLPVILMQPHEERPRQHLFRQYLLKPSVLVIPVWVLFWLIDCLEVLIEVQIVHPFYYFTIVHMLFPAVLVWYLMQLQAADERLVLEQRETRQAESGIACNGLQPIAVEDPAPTLLREFISVNPVALVWLGSVASVPIVACSMLTPLKTDRARLAQGYVNMIYAPLMFLQLAFAYILHHVRFIELPRLYMAAFGLLLSVPCFLVWCCCLMCTSRYGRQDMALVEKQRLERAKKICGDALPTAAAEEVVQSEAASSPSSAAPPIAMPAAPRDLVDFTEAMQREWEYIFTA